jgi:argininosuccinate synthase
MITWLKETYGCEVVAFAADVGQGKVETAPLMRKAKATGAVKCIVKDLRKEFLEEYVWPTLRAGAKYESVYLLGTSFARPVIAKHQVLAAWAEGCDAVAHGATGKGNDQVRFELAYYHFNPAIKVVAPWREWDLNSRQALIEYAKKNGIPIPTIKKRPWSSDRNLLHISFEGGILEDTWAEAPEEMYVLTRSPEKAPNKAQYVEIEFKNGNAVAVDGVKLTPAKLLAHLNEIGGVHGIGRVDLLENRSVGMKSRGVYETPGGTILREAHSAVEQITMDREVMRIRDGLIPEYAKQIYAGYWFSPERLMLQTLIDDSQKCVNGVARLKLYKGLCRTVGRKSESDSLFNLDFATFEKDQVFNQADAEGFIKINSLRLRIRSLMQANRKK